MATAVATKGNIHDKMNATIHPSPQQLPPPPQPPTPSYLDETIHAPSPPSVTPSTTTSAKSITLTISDVKGKDVQIKISSSDRVSMLKKKVSSSLEGAKLKNCRAVHQSGRPLSDNLCLRSQNVQNQDCILLLPKKENPRNGTTPFYPCPNGPNKSTINRATKHLPKAPLGKPNFPLMPPDATDFFRDLRRILHSLIDSAYLLQSADQLCGGGREVGDPDEIGEEMESGPEDELGAAPINEVDNNAVQTLTSMGYSRATAIHALRINKMEITEAKDWLVRNSSNEIPVVTSSQMNKSIPSKSPNKKKTTSPTSSVKTAKSRCVDSEAIRNLKDMGFKEEDIVHALQLTGNNQEEACEWLLGEKTEPLSTMRLSKNSKLYKDLFNDPVVQLGLTSPHNLQVLEDMLRNPELVSQYFNDPEVGPLLLHISKIAIGHGGGMKNT